MTKDKYYINYLSNEIIKFEYDIQYSLLYINVMNYLPYSILKFEMQIVFYAYKMDKLPPNIKYIKLNNYFEIKLDNLPVNIELIELDKYYESRLFKYVHNYKKH